MFSILINVAFWLPIKIGFQTYLKDKPFSIYIVEFITDLIFIIDLYINCKTAYYNEKDELIVDRKVIDQVIL